MLLMNIPRTNYIVDTAMYGRCAEAICSNIMARGLFSDAVLCTSHAYSALPGKLTMPTMCTMFNYCHPLKFHYCNITA